MKNRYTLIDDWHIEGAVFDIADVLGEGPDYARWWSSVYLDVTIVEPGDERKVGQVLDIHAKGWLPYTLRFRAHVTESRYPYGFSMNVTGDFLGVGVWTLEEHGPIVHARFIWTVEVAKPLIRHFSFLFHRIFAANHRWAMRQGEESLRRELARRRAEPTAVPEPTPTND